MQWIYSAFFQSTQWEEKRFLYQFSVVILVFTQASSALSHKHTLSVCLSVSTACKRKEQDHGRSERGNVSKKPRLVFTDVQRRTLHAIFKENKRPSKELQVTIAQQLGLELATVSNFFMNARRRSLDKWVDDGSGHSVNSGPNACTKAWRWTDLTNSWTD